MTSQGCQKRGQKSYKTNNFRCEKHHGGACTVDQSHEDPNCNNICHEIDSYKLSGTFAYTELSPVYWTASARQLHLNRMPKCNVQKVLLMVQVRQGTDETKKGALYTWEKQYVGVSHRNGEKKALKTFNQGRKKDRNDTVTNFHRYMNFDFVALANPGSFY